MDLEEKGQNSNRKKEDLIEFAKNDKIDTYRPQRIIQSISQESLRKIQRLMKEHPQLNVAQFIRLLSYILKPLVPEFDEFYLVYGLFCLFKELCRSYKKATIGFSEISNYLTEQMPIVDQEVIVKEKLLPVSLQISKKDKLTIAPPEVQGKMIHERQMIEKFPCMFDKFQHTNRVISQACYSPVYNIYMTIDLPSHQIRILDKNFALLRTVKSELEISKKDAVVSYLAWSNHEARLGAILGNYSLSFWSQEDNFRFEVNVPLPGEHLSNPYVFLGYMQSLKVWYTIDNRPVVHVLSSRNFEPRSSIKNFKMVKEKSNQKIHCLQMSYQKLLCVGFERKIFLLSLETLQVVTELSNTFKTAITSIAFSETYQALLVSNYNSYFKVFQLTQFCDLTEKGKFQGHKHQIMLLGVLQTKPVVYSLDENYVLKVWDLRDFTCYETFSVLKNIEYQQMLSVNGGVCFVGSKLYMYRWISEKNALSSKALINDQSVKVEEKVVLLTSIKKNIVIVTNRALKLYSYHTGCLIKVLKGLFENDEDITFAFYNESKGQVYVSNEDGRFITLETDKLTIIHRFTFISRPMAMNYTEMEDLITLCSSMGQIHICEYKRAEGFTLKRKILNKEQVLKHVRVSSLHDLIAVIFEPLKDTQKSHPKSSPSEEGQNQESHCRRTSLYFYTFERSKPLTCLSIPCEYDEFVQFELHPRRHILLILTKKRLLVYEMKRSINPHMAFTLKYQIDLWEGLQFNKGITEEFKQYTAIIQEKIESKGFVLLQDDTLVMFSTYSCLFAVVSLNLYHLSPDQIKKRTSDSSYNPYRICVQIHSDEAFYQQQENVAKIENDTLNPSLMKASVKYFHTKAHSATKSYVQVGNVFGIYNEKRDLHFFDTNGKLMGVVNSDLTLPKMWELYCYQQSELQDIAFVLDFIENQKSANSLDVSNAIFQLTLSKDQQETKLKKKNLLTVEKIVKAIPETILKEKEQKVFSLRERKLLLEKEREEKERMQDFLEHQQEEEQYKIKSYLSQDSQTSINETLNFFSVNRIQNIKNKGIKEKDYPKVKAFQKKLLNSVKTEREKLSLEMPATVSKKTVEDILFKKIDTEAQKGEKLKLSTTNILNSFLHKNKSSQYQSSKVLDVTQKKVFLKVLDTEVKTSKVKSLKSLSSVQKRKTFSLPSLKRGSN